MLCTNIKKNKGGKILNQKLTYNRVWLLFNLLHVNVVHLSFVEWIGLLPGTPIVVSISCFKCGKTGHYATECPEAKNGNGNGSAGKKPNPFNKRQVNHINVEEVEGQPDAVIGKFLVNSFTTLDMYEFDAPV